MLLCFLFFLITYNCTTQTSESSSFTQYDQLRNGDLIVRQGKGYFSNYFRKYASEAKQYSHIGIVAIEDTLIYVYHSEASELTGIGRVKKEKLSSFLDGIEVYGFFRLKYATEITEKVVKEA